MKVEEPTLFYYHVCIWKNKQMNEWVCMCDDDQYCDDNDDNSVCDDNDNDGNKK